MAEYPLEFDNITPPGTIERLTGVRPDGLPDGVHTGGAFLTEAGEVWKPCDCKPYANAPCRVSTREHEFLNQFTGPFLPRNWRLEEYQGRSFIVRKRAIIYTLNPDRASKWEEPLSGVVRSQLLELEKSIRTINQFGWSIGDAISLGFDLANYEPFIVDLSAAHHLEPAYFADDTLHLHRFFELCGATRLKTFRDNARTVLHNWVYNLDLSQEERQGRKGHNHIYASFNRPISGMWARGLGEFHHEKAGHWEKSIPWSWVITKQPLSDEDIARYELTWGWSKLHPTGEEA